MSAARNNLVTLGASLYARKCRGERIDALDRLPYFRLMFLREREAGYELEFTEYGWLPKSAMKPTLRTLRDAETAIAKAKTPEGYIERMRRVDPVVAAVFGPVFDAMFPARAAA